MRFAASDMLLFAYFIVHLLDCPATRCQDVMAEWGENWDREGWHDANWQQAPHLQAPLWQAEVAWAALPLDSGLKPGNLYTNQQAHLLQAC
jgi:hypothetical protein